MTIIDRLIHRLAGHEVESRYGSLVVTRRTTVTEAVVVAQYRNKPNAFIRFTHSLREHELIHRPYTDWTFEKYVRRADRVVVATYPA